MINFMKLWLLFTGLLILALIGSILFVGVVVAPLYLVSKYSSLYLLIYIPAVSAWAAYEKLYN